MNCLLIGLLPLWQRIWSIAMRPMFLISGVFFTFESVPLPWRDLLWWNPLVHIVGLVRLGLYPGYDAAYVSPAYLLAPEDGTPSTLYTDPLSGKPYQDLFGVRGQQGYVTYADYPQVGAVPYSCVWTARGTIETDPDTGGSLVLWRQAERLTSGVRDAHRIEVSCALNAGCAVTWQEDPEGLRPGDGEGPGEGWSGAVAHKGTDIWYSFMDWANFDAVDVDGDGIADDPLEATGALKPLVPMAIPVRLTDNEKCSPDDSKPYCYGDIDGDLVAGDLCTEETVSYINRQNALVTACITNDGRVMNGQTAATRPRISVQPFRISAGGTAERGARVIRRDRQERALRQLRVQPAGGAAAEPAAQSAFCGLGHRGIHRPGAGGRLLQRW